MKKKNILFIFADQLRTDFCGCYGADFLKTPNIDALAQRGVQYNGAVTASPACVPARAAMLTGKSPLANRVLGNNQWLRPDHDEMGIHTWATQLAENGYHTSSIGKMHFYPWDISEGFEHRVIAEDKRHTAIHDDYTIFLNKNGYKRLHASASEGYYEHKGATISYLPEEMQIDRFVCNETLDYLGAVDKERPFAMIVGFPGPHCPYDPSKEMMDKMQTAPMPKAAPITQTSKQFLAQNRKDNLGPWNGVDIADTTPEQIEKIRLHYCALVQALDSYVGEIIQKLKNEGIYDDTIIIFSADHGDYLGDYGMAGKGHFYDSAVRIPLIVQYPGQAHKEYNHVVSLSDVYSTVLNFAGIDVEDTVDSTTLAPFGKTEKRAAVFGANERGWMLRESQYQYNVYFNNVREMFDFIKDPQMQNNLLCDSAFAQKAEEMRNEIEKRAFDAINDGNSDLIAKPGDFHQKKDMRAFNYKGWKRPFPNSL